MSDLPAAIFVALGGAYGTITFGRVYRLCRYSNGWARTHAEVQHSQVKVRRTYGRRDVHLSGEALITYRYVVDHERYVGTQIHFGPTWEWLAIREARRYPDGASISIAYDPENPEDSVIRPGVTVGTMVCFAGAIALLLVGLAWVYGSLMSTPG